MKIQIKYIETKSADNPAIFQTWTDELREHVKINFKDTNIIESENVSLNTITINDQQFVERTVVRVFSSYENFMKYNDDPQLVEYRKERSSYNLNNQITTKVERSFIN